MRTIPLTIFLLACATTTPMGPVMTEKSPAASAYESTCQRDLATARDRLATLEAYDGARTVSAVLAALNDLWIVIDAGSNQAGLYRSVHPDEGVRAVADTCEQEFSKVSTDVGLSRPLYDLVSGLDTSAADTLTARYVAHLSRDFRRAGVDQDEATRATVRALRDDLVKIGQAFSDNIRKDVRKVQIDAAALAGLPEDYVASHAPREDGRVTITTDYPDYLPFMTYARSDAARLDLYRAFRKRGHPDNLEVLSSLLHKRHALATLLGYESWAAYVTEDKMIQSADNARAFIDKIATVSQERAKLDYQELLRRLQDDEPRAKRVGDWQKSYVEELVKKEKYQFDSQEVRKYFNYENTRAGLFSVTSRMFNITYRPIDVPVWDPAVTAYEVVDGTRVLGRFYLDMHPRDNKYKHAAAFPLVTGVADRQIPEAALVCNFPAEGAMEHDQVETFFHEFGHLLHHIFGGAQPYLGVSGFNTEWDFVEAPSQMLEEWAWDLETLQSFARDDAGTPIPEPLVAAMRRARDFGKGLWVTHQMFYASLSLTYYNQDPSGIETTTLMKEMQRRYSLFEYVDDTYFQLSFGHLDGYSAIYYTYMWSLVIAKDLFSVFQDKGLLSPEAAKRYRDFVLSPGGSKDAAQMVREFLQRDYTFDAFAHWLNG
jgi:thimet oligopeptidase